MFLVTHISGMSVKFKTLFQSFKEDLARQTSSKLLKYNPKFLSSSSVGCFWQTTSKVLNCNVEFSPFLKCLGVFGRSLRMLECPSLSLWRLSVIFHSISGVLRTVCYYFLFLRLNLLKYRHPLAIVGMPSYWKLDYMFNANVFVK